MSSPGDAASPYRLHSDRLTLQVKVIANAGRSELAGVRNGELVIRLQAPALQGRANRELLRLLGRRLGLPPSALVLVSGETSPHKLLRLPTQAAESVRALCRATS